VSVLATTLLYSRPDMPSLRRFFLALLLLSPAVPAAAQASPSWKLDDALRESVVSGCSGTQSVIIRTKHGDRESLRKTLVAAGRTVKGEFPALDAVTAEVSCADLITLAESSSTHSISLNSPIYGHQLDAVDSTVSTTTDSSTSVSDTASSAADSTYVDAELAFTDTSLFAGTTSSSLFARILESLSAASLQSNFFSTLAVRRTFATTWNWSNNVGVAVIDSGIEPGLNFGSRITAFYDFTQGDIRPTAPSDEYGHGTHVAGLIAGAYVGVAPTARLVGLKVLDAQGRGTTDNVIRAIEFAIAAKDVLNIQIVNLSLGHPVFEPAATDPLVQAVEHAVRAGLTVVVSAGNFGRNRVTGAIGFAGIASPGNAPSAISVGSVRTFNTSSRGDDRVAAYSSRGPSWYDGFAKPDVSAPGDNLLSVAALGSTLRLVQESRGNVGNYMRLSGTSMAAGVASGVAALVLQANRGLTPNALKAVLQYSALPVKNDTGQEYDALTQGVGSIVGVGAVALAKTIDASVPVGSNWLRAELNPSTTIGGQTYVWAQKILWGNHVARGAGIISEQRPAWALDIVWGDGIEDDDNIVWGNYDDDDNIVWGNTFDLDDNIVWGNNIVWPEGWSEADSIVWGSSDDDNVVWGNSIVWGDGLIGISLDDDNIVWGNLDDDNIVWGNLDDDNIVWGNLDDDNIVWGNNDDDNVVWGNSDDDNVVWGNGALLGTVIRKSDFAPGHLKHVQGVKGKAEEVR
jgi:serine protease AprX